MLADTGAATADTDHDVGGEYRLGRICPGGHSNSLRSLSVFTQTTEASSIIWISAGRDPGLDRQSANLCGGSYQIDQVTGTRLGQGQ